MTGILLSAPDVGVVEMEYVTDAIRSGWIAPAGPDLEAFEQEIADRVEAPFAVALSSGTAALHLALYSWGVGAGDVVPVSTLTFAASVNAIRYVGAEPHFVDAEPESGNMDPALLERALCHLAGDGRRVPAVITVDLLGKVADMSAIHEVATAHSVKVLCDAAESFGASSAGVPAGSFGDASVLSFNGNKIMTTSGGGMLLTEDERLAAHVRKIANQAREPVAHYEHTELGFNYRLSNILAALGRAQLSRLDGMMARRRAWRESYRRLFDGQPGVRILGGDDDAQDNCWLTAIIVDPAESPWSTDDLRLALADQQIESRPLWKPMHAQPVFANFGATLTGVSDALFEQGLTLPSGSVMSDSDFELIASVIQSRIGQGHG